jgi:hypothetical protein
MGARVLEGKEGPPRCITFRDGCPSRGCFSASGRWSDDQCARRAYSVGPIGRLAYGLVPRPNGLAAAEMNAKISALGKRVRAQERGSTYDPTVKIKHVKAEPRRTAKQQKIAETPPRYPGWRPVEKTCQLESCKTRFMPVTPVQLYHTPACQAEAERGHRRTTAADKRDRRKQRPEAQLGEPVTHRGNPLKRTCGLPGCDTEFIPKHHRERYCSPEHRTEGKRKLKRDHARKSRGITSTLSHPTSATRDAITTIEQLEPPTDTAYLVMLWRRVNEDPDCPEATYDRLERILGLRPDLTPPGSSIPTDGI